MQYGFEQDAPRRSLTGEFKCTLESSTNFRVGSNELRVSTAGRYLRQADAPLHYQRFRKRPHCGWSYSCQMSNCYSMRVAIFYYGMSTPQLITHTSAQGNTIPTALWTLILLEPFRTGSQDVHSLGKIKCPIWLFGNISKKSTLYMVRVVCAICSQQSVHFEMRRLKLLLKVFPQPNCWY